MSSSERLRGRYSDVRYTIERSHFEEFAVSPAQSRPGPAGSTKALPAGRPPGALAPPAVRAGRVPDSVLVPRLLDTADLSRCNPMPPAQSVRPRSGLSLEERFLPATRSLPPELATGGRWQPSPKIPLGARSALRDDRRGSSPSVRVPAPARFPGPPRPQTGSAVEGSRFPLDSFGPRYP